MGGRAQQWRGRLQQPGERDVVRDVAAVDVIEERRLIGWGRLGRRLRHDSDDVAWHESDPQCAALQESGCSRDLPCDCREEAAVRAARRRFCSAARAGRGQCDRAPDGRREVDGVLQRGREEQRQIRLRLRRAAPEAARGDVRSHLRSLCLGKPRLRLLRQLKRRGADVGEAKGGVASLQELTEGDRGPRPCGEGLAQQGLRHGSERKVSGTAPQGQFARTRAGASKNKTLSQLPS